MENAEEGQKDQGRAGRVPGGCPGRLEPTELICLSQVFKFIYCCRLAEMGLATQAFHYCEAIAKSVLAAPRRHSPVLLGQLAQVTPPAAQGPGAAAARARAQTSRPGWVMHVPGREQVFAPQQRALRSFGVRRACLQEAHVPGHPSLAGLGPGCGPTAPTTCSMRQKARDDRPPAPSIHVPLSLEWH